MEVARGVGLEARPAGVAVVLLGVALHAPVVPVLLDVVVSLVFSLVRARDLEVELSRDISKVKKNRPARGRVAKREGI